MKWQASDLSSLSDDKSDVMVFVIASVVLPISKREARAMYLGSCLCHVAWVGWWKIEIERCLADVAFADQARRFDRRPWVPFVRMLTGIVAVACVVLSD